MQLAHIHLNGGSCVQRLADLLQRRLLMLIHLGHRAAKGEQLVGEGRVHLLHKAADDAPNAVHLRARRPHQEVVHRLRNGLHRAADGVLHCARELPRQGVGEGGKHVVGVLILADELHIVVQRARHRQRSEVRHEVVNRAIAGALQNAVDNVEADGAADASDGCAEGELHPSQQRRDALDNLVGVGEVEAAQTVHHAHERAQNAQRGQQTRNQIGQLRIARPVDDGIVVDVVLNVAGQTAAVKLLGVLQEAQPAVLQPVAHKAFFLPDGCALPGAGILLQAGDSAAQGVGCGNQGNQALENANQRDPRDGTVHQRVGQVRQMAGEPLQNFIKHGQALLWVVSLLLYHEKAVSVNVQIVNLALRNL